MSPAHRKKRLGNLEPWRRPRRRPEGVIADRAATTTTNTADCSAERRITPVVARCQTEHGSEFGPAHWVVERTSAHLHNFKRLLVRFERRSDIRAALLDRPAASSAPTTRSSI
jgi:transposase